MECATRKIRSPLKWHGGKSYLARRIISLFPPHSTYIEPYFGGGSVLLNKTPCDLEITGDLNAGLILMWRTLRDQGFLVADELRKTPYSSKSFAVAEEVLKRSPEPRDIPVSCAFIVRNRMSRGGMGKDFAWSDRLRGKRRPRGPVPGEINSWETFIESDLPAAVERVRSVGFQIASANALIHNFKDTPGTVIYCDPPYLHETRTAKKVYDFEMSRDDHEAMLLEVAETTAKVFVSGYRSTLYDEALSDWTRHEFDMPNHSGQGKSKQRRVECVWESPS